MDISVKHLKCMLPFVAKQDIRYYLNGLAIQGDKMITSDGHRMTICRLDGDTGLDVIVPISAVKAAIQLAETSSVEITGERIGDVFYKPIEGTFPNWKKIVPKALKKSSNKYFAFNPRYLGDYSKMKVILGCTRYDGIVIYQETEHSPAVIDINEDRFFCLLMPIHADSAKASIPDWISEVSEQETKLKKAA
jgi:DNA polymerase III sliding clamp (beta) subunit (PCNA family)